jgi:hypothetical protein
LAALGGMRGEALMDTIDHGSWLGFALDKALATGLTQPDRLIHHVTPEVLVGRLPQELTTLVITNALSAGKLTPENLIEVAPPKVLAKHVDPALLWKCIVDVAQAHKLDVKGTGSSDIARRWLGDVLRQALDLRIVTPAEVVRHVPPAEWVKDAPLNVVAEMIRAGLTRGVFNPELALVHLTPKLIAEKLQPILSWSCIVDGMRRILELTSGAGAQKMDAHVLHREDKEDPTSPLDLADDVFPPFASAPPPVADKNRRSKGGSKGFEKVDTNVEGLDVVEEAPLPPPPPSPGVAHRRA